MEINAQWFEDHRGITQATLDAFKVRFEENSVVFPYATGDKIRSFDLDGKRTFKFSKGMTPHLFFSGDAPNYSGTAFLCEGETDTMRLWQEFQGCVGVFGLGGLLTWRDDFGSLFRNFEKVYVILDNEAEYENPTAHAQVNDVWLKIRKVLGSKVKRIRLPAGVNDVCEFFEMGYDLDSLRILMKKNASVSHFKPLDLTKEPPPADWLLDGIAAKGDIDLVSGPPGLGKSWFTMGLSVAVAEGWQTFLGRAVRHSGRVLYFDEENPEDVVFDRLKRLGLTNVGNLRYIWNNGIRIDKIPDLVLEEALDYEPELIVLDSLSRIHTGEENAVGSMAPLLNDCIKPLARETGAAVMLIHHMDKAMTGPRGSGDISASVDTVIDAFPTFADGAFKLRLSKSRRRLTGDLFSVRITDIPDGSVRLVVDEYNKPPIL